MAESKVLAWGVLCGSGERAGEIHRGTDDSLWAFGPYEAEDAAPGVKRLDENFACGPHRIAVLVELVPLGVVERAESKGGELMAKFRVLVEHTYKVWVTVTAPTETEADWEALSMPWEPSTLATESRVIRVERAEPTKEGEPNA